MASMDGGHLFLTVLAPVIVGDDIDDAGLARSHRHLLARALAELPTGRQTVRSPADAQPSPLARNNLNHLARFVVIDGPAYNGRISGDTLLNMRTDPLKPQPVDALPSPYLLFAADVDAQGLEEATALQRYTDALWETMPNELGDIFGHCRGFPAQPSAATFHDYIRRCQVETTMPFNDYWPHDELTQAKPVLSPRGVVIGAVLAAAALAGLWWLTPVRHWPWWAAALLVLAVIAAALFGLVRWIVARGARPFPTAPGSDLPSVLKALFLQQAFTRFVIETQGATEATLHESFGRFLTAVDPAGPTPAQQPGAVAAPSVVW